MRIRGRIVTETGEPVARARISLLDGDTELISGTSGNDGSFNMVREDEPAGALHLRVSREGFQTYDGEVSASSNEELRVTLSTAAAGAGWIYGAGPG